MRAEEFGDAVARKVDQKGGGIRSRGEVRVVADGEGSGGEGGSRVGVNVAIELARRRDKKDDGEAQSECGRRMTTRVDVWLIDEDGGIMVMVVAVVERLRSRLR